jgi:hypothetical protein
MFQHQINYLKLRSKGMENEKKTSSSQNVLNIILVIICGAIMGLFVYDYINKNDQIAEYKNSEQKRIKATEEQLAKVNKLTSLYKEASFNNTSEGLVTDEENEQIKSDIARNVSSNLSPIMAKMDKSQGITNEKLDKIMNELIDLLEKETKKSKDIRKKMASAIEKERRVEARLQRDLSETQKTVADLNGMVGELKALYVSSMEEDSSIGDIIRCATAPAKFLQNTLTFDWFVARDRRSAKNSIEQKQADIMERYNAIGDPAALRQLKLKRRKRIKQNKQQKHKRRRKVSEPEIIRK